MAEHTQAITEDFAHRLSGVLGDDKIQAVTTALRSQAAASSVPASGGVMSAIFYVRFGLAINPGTPFAGPFFTGNAGGVTTPGGGNLRGDVYCSDLPRMYKETVSFEFNAAIVYTSLLFFDGSSNLLGHFQGTSSFSTLAGVGGGTGSWSSTPLDDDMPIE